MLINLKTKQILVCQFLLCFVFLLGVSAQSSDVGRRINQARLNYDNGDFSRSIENAEMVIAGAKKSNDKILVTQGFQVLANAQISLQKYEDAEKSLNEVLRYLNDTKAAAIQKANIYLSFGSLRRSQRRFAESFEYSKKAVFLAPDNQQILAEHYLNLGRILYASGYDLSAIVWLEKAENILEKTTISTSKLDVYRFLALAWWAKLNYKTALQYAQKWEDSAEKTRFKRLYRQALFDSATILSESGQRINAMRYLDKGLKLALANDDFYQAGIFLTSLLLNSLDKDDSVKAFAYLNQLEKVNRNDSFSFEILLGRAIIAAYNNDNEKSRLLFSQLEKMENSSEFILPGWKAKIAKKNLDWQGLIELNRKLLDLTVQNNFRDELPGIYLDFAKAHFRLNNLQTAEEYLRKSLTLIEEIRTAENYELSFGLSENYHEAYRLLTEIKLENAQESFELADFLKARILKDRINDAAIKFQSIISPAIRKKLEKLSLEYFDNQSFASEIEMTEKFVTANVPQLKLAKQDLSETDKIPDFDDVSIVSYFFTLDKNLLAFVKESGKPVKIVRLNFSEEETDALVKTVEQKIKNFIFFKRDGKEIYDKLLKPLNLVAKHFVIVPDKSLWKIPFQALSADGEKYLIEDKLISYAPSISILLEQMKSAKPNRQTLRAFANPNYNNKFLQYAASEAAQVGEIYDSVPVQNATIADFEKDSQNSDILHFSMHAQIDGEQPLESFLGFRKTSAKDDGRLTVGKLLRTKLKKGSLAFFASCDTNNVLSGEGLVSLAWAAMGSGATTVIFSDWEANDKSTQTFTKAFYTNYKKGNSSAEALQEASLKLIKNKSSNMHEPYYWANFTLSGDYR